MYCPWPCLMCICLNNFQMVCQSQEHAACAFENAVFEKLSEYQGHHHHHHHHDLNTTTDILSHNHSSIFDAPSPPSHPSPLIPLLSSHPLTPLSLSLCGWPSSQYPLIPLTHPTHPFISSLFSHTPTHRNRHWRIARPGKRRREGIGALPPLILSLIILSYPYLKTFWPPIQNLIAPFS